jgi:hypothetical protein
MHAVVPARMSAGRQSRGRRASDSLGSCESSRVNLPGGNLGRRSAVGRQSEFGSELRYHGSVGYLMHATVVGQPEI